MRSIAIAYCVTFLALAFAGVVLSQDGQFANKDSSYVYAAATKKLMESKTAKKHYNVRNYHARKFEFFPNADKLLLAESEWKKHFTVLQDNTMVQTEHLSLKETGAKLGDVVLLQVGSSSKQVLPLVYFGERNFPKGKSYSFFIYPYSSRSGLELNTMPPRFHRSMLEDWKVLKDAKVSTNKGEEGAKISKTLVMFSEPDSQEGLTIEWLRYPTIQNSLYVRTRWWKSGTSFRVLRPTLQSDQRWGFNREKFFTSYRSKFGSLTQSQVDGLQQLLGFAEKDAEMDDIQWVAYMFATVKIECADQWQPITEKGTKSYFNDYDIEFNPTKAKRLGNTEKGDGYLYRGRGYCQLTGKANYRIFGPITNVNLVSSPDEALEPSRSYKIMSYGMVKGAFTGRKLSDYEVNGKLDYYQARAVINADKDKKHPPTSPTTNGEKLRRYAVTFEEILRASSE